MFYFKVKTIKRSGGTFPITRSSGQDTVGRFSAIFDTGDKFCDFLFVFLLTKPLLKRILD